MPALEGWDLDAYRGYLKVRARLIGLDPRIRIRFDESDLVQETLLKAADPATPQCRGETAAERLAWLEEIQNHLYIDRYREANADKRDVKLEREFRQLISGSTVSWEKNFADPGDTPLEQVMKKEIALKLALAIQELPADQRDVVMAREMLHLSLEETAQVLGKTVGSVAGLYRRGLKSLKEHLRRYHDSKP